jgi:RNA polymerase, sigma-24 subunit, ECF subfamily
MLLYTQVIGDPQQKRLFEDVYAAYRGRMLALARRRLRTPEDAEDAVHQAFLSLAEHFHRLARLPRPELEAYLTVVVERKCIDLLRQQARLSGTPFDETLPLVTPPPCGDTLADAMGRLPPRYREALLLRHACGYSTRETAALLELSFAAAQKLLYRARDALRAELEKEAISL